MVADQSIDFQAYLQSLCKDDTYKDWHGLYTPIDALDSQLVEPKKSRRRWDLSLMVQTIQPPEQEGKAPESKQNERLEVLKGLRKYAVDHVLLKGRPGSGKSTALQRLLWEEARKALATEEETRIPVFLELKRKKPVLQLIHDFFIQYRLNLNITKIEDLLFAGQFLLLLDGLNELPNEDARRDLESFRLKYRSATPMIFTTRDLGVDLSIERKLEMLSLNELQMQQFVCAYLPEVGEEMLRRLGGRLRELGKTPLLLWMLCDVFDQLREIPTNLGSLFRCFSAEYDKLKQDVPVAEGLRHWQSDLLQHLAFVMIQGNNHTELQSTITKQQARKVLTEFLQGKVAHPDDCARRWLADLLKYHLIQLRTDEQIEFRHQLLQEYYAGEKLLQMLPQINPEKLKRDYLNYLKWTEPLALMLALPEVTEKQVVQVVKSALEVDFSLGAKLAGAVKQELQKKTVDLVIERDVPQELKIRLLGKTRSNNAIPDLIKALIFNEQNSNISWYAADSLGNIGSELAVSSLLTFLEHEWPHVRRNSAYALGKIGSEFAVYALLEFLNSKHSDVRQNAASALGDIRSKTGITKLLNSLEDEESSVRREAATALGKIGSPVAIPGLLKALNDQGFWVSESATFALGEISSDVAVPEILAFVKNKALVFREKNIYFRDFIEDEEFLIEIIQRLEEENQSFINAATWALQQIDSELTIHVLLNHLKDEYFLVRANAAYALGEIATEEIVPALLETLNDENLAVREQSAYALGKIGNEAAVPALLEALQDKTYLIRASAATALGQISASNAATALLQSLKDKYALVRANATYALGQIVTDVTDEAFAGLISALKDPDFSVRRNAVLSLGNIFNEDVVSHLVTSLKDSDIWVRAYAAEKLGKIGSKAAIIHLLKALEDPNPSVRRGAIRGLEQIRTEIAITKLLAVLNDKEPYVRRDAVYCLGRIAHSHTLPNLTELLQANEETYLLDTIAAIQKRCNYYNYVIATSPPPEEENLPDTLLDILNKLNQTMSETPKVQNNFNFNAPINGNVAGNIEGDMIGTQNNYSAADNIVEVEQVLQQLLEQIENTKPTPIEAQVIVGQAVEKHPVLKDGQIIEQAIKRYPPLKVRLQRVATAVGIETVKVLFAPAGIVIEAIKAWIEPE